MRGAGVELARSELVFRDNALGGIWIRLGIGTEGVILGSGRKDGGSEEEAPAAADGGRIKPFKNTAILTTTVQLRHKTGLWQRP